MPAFDAMSLVPPNAATNAAGLVSLQKAAEVGTAAASGAGIMGFDPASIIFSLALKAMGIGPKGSQATPMTPEERKLFNTAQKVDQAVSLLDSASSNDFDNAGAGETVEATVLDAYDAVTSLSDSDLEFFGDSKDFLLNKLTNAGGTGGYSNNLASSMDPVATLNAADASQDDIDALVALLNSGGTNVGAVGATYGIDPAIIQAQLDSINATASTAPVATAGGTGIVEAVQSGINAAGTKVGEAIDTVFTSVGLPPPSVAILNPNSQTGTLVWGQNSGSPVINTGVTPGGTRTGVTSGSAVLDNILNGAVSIITGKADAGDLLSSGTIKEVVTATAADVLGVDIDTATAAIESINDVVSATTTPQSLGGNDNQTKVAVNLEDITLEPTGGAVTSADVINSADILGEGPTGPVTGVTVSDPPVVIDDDLPPVVIDDDLPPVVIDDDLPPVVIDDDPPVVIDDDLPPVVIDDDPPVVIDDDPPVVIDDDPPVVIDLNESVDPPKTPLDPVGGGGDSGDVGSGGGAFGIRTTPGEVGEIEYYFDVFGNSIFAPNAKTLEEEDPVASLYSGYAEGGIVQDYDVEQLIKYLKSSGN